MIALRANSIAVVASVVALLLVGELTLRLVDPWIPEPSKWPTVETEIKSDQLEELAAEIDLLLLGSSITEAGVDPEILEEQLNMVVYNSAMPFMSPKSHEVWLEGLVLDMAAPDVVVIGLRGWVSDNPDERLADGLARAIDPPLVDRWLEWSQLASRRGLFSDWDRLGARSRLIDSGQITERGHQVGYYELEARSLELPQRGTGAATMQPDQKTALESLVHSLKNSEIDVMFFIEPGRPSESARFEVGTERYRDRLIGIAAELDVPIWNAFGFTRDPDLFADSLHFNRAGTEVFSYGLAQRIEALIGG